MEQDQITFQRRVCVHKLREAAFYLWRLSKTYSDLIGHYV